MSQISTPAPADQSGNPLAEGRTIAVLAGPVLVIVQCIRPAAAYRLSIRNAAGFEIAELSYSLASESVIRSAARTATILFRGGYSVAEVIALLAITQEVAR